MSTKPDDTHQSPDWSSLYSTDCPPEDSCLPDDTGESIELFYGFKREGTESSFTKPEDLFNFMLRSKILNSNEIYYLIAQSGFELENLFKEFGTYLDNLCKDLKLYPANFVEEAVDGVYVNNLSTSSLARNLSGTFKREAMQNAGLLFTWLTISNIDKYKAIMIMGNIILQIYDDSKSKNQKNFNLLKKILVIGAITSAFHKMLFET